MHAQPPPAPMAYGWHIEDDFRQPPRHGRDRDDYEVLRMEVYALKEALYHIQREIAEMRLSRFNTSLRLRSSTPSLTPSDSISHVNGEADIVKSHTRRGGLGIRGPAGARFHVDAWGSGGNEDVRAWLQLLAAPPTLLRALYFREESYAGTEGTGGGEGVRRGGEPTRGRDASAEKELIFELR
ncbi:hypothetical protein PLEOSDRAFT_1109443 [Pleurotus ostreatus PC15]|uniref:Uncharacterized protein n=1 Tax=Pleurotus ostreatus (strain PC15) TaxID=1137138 RepID=A0A067N2X9_PLEO1|nr:hypothetical protein PLEOSDRAFT_1109443 [Pleurotus ostreatus PC15]